MAATYLRGFIFLVLVLGVANCCDEQAIADCSTTFSNAIQGRDLYASTQVFDSFCQNEMATLKSCLSGKTTGCGIAVKKLFEGIFNSYSYMCDAGKSDTLLYGACSESQANKDKIANCQNIMTNRISNDPSLDKRCGFINEFISCSGDATVVSCGAGSKTWYDKVISLSTGPVLEEAGCGCSGLVATITLLAGALLFQWLFR